MCFVVTCWERADLLALVCGVYCEFVTFPLVSWVRCGTWLYRFLIFAPLPTLKRNMFTSKNIKLFYSSTYFLILHSMTFDLISGLHMQIQTWHPPLRLCTHAKYYVKSGLTNVLKNANKTKNMHLFSIRIANYTQKNNWRIFRYIAISNIQYNKN